MGPWFIRDQVNPFHPGCSYETLRRLVARGKVRPDTVVRGPTTRQFWSFAKNTPGVAHLLGACHACATPTRPTAPSCQSCGASFIVAEDRQTLGLAPVQLLPGDTDPSAVADAAFGPTAPDTPVASATAPRPPVEPAAHAAPAASPAAPTASPASIRGPVRRKSKGPVIAVVASVACAAAVFGALVVVSNSTAGSEDQPAEAAALDPSQAAEQREAPDSPTAVAALQSDLIEAATPNEPRALSDAAEPSPDIEPAAEPVGEPETQPDTDEGTDQETLPDVPAEPETETDASPPAPDVATEAADSRAITIGTMTRAELREAITAWRASGDDSLVAAAERRFAQLELRAAFGPD